MKDNRTRIERIERQNEKLDTAIARMVFVFSAVMTALVLDTWFL